MAFKYYICSIKQLQGLCKFQSQIVFSIKEVSSKDFVNQCKVSIDDIVTWQRGELCVEA